MPRKPLPHAFTKETAQEMQARSAAKRRENAKRFRERMQDALEPSAEDIVKKALASEDWQAWFRAVDTAYGRPKETAEVEHSGEVQIVVRSMFSDDPADSGSAGGGDEKAG